MFNSVQSTGTKRYYTKGKLRMAGGKQEHLCCNIHFGGSLRLRAAVPFRKLLMPSRPDLMPATLSRLYIMYEFVMPFDVKKL